jgi:hypothetical protein
MEQLRSGTAITLMRKVKNFKISFLSRFQWSIAMQSKRNGVAIDNNSQDKGCFGGLLKFERPDCFTRKRTIQVRLSTNPFHICNSVNARNYNEGSAFYRSLDQIMSCQYSCHFWTMNTCSQDAEFVWFHSFPNIEISC